MERVDLSSGLIEVYLISSLTKHPDGLTHSLLDDLLLFLLNLLADDEVSVSCASSGRGQHGPISSLLLRLRSFQHGDLALDPAIEEGISELILWATFVGLEVCRRQDEAGHLRLVLKFVFESPVGFEDRYLLGNVFFFVVLLKGK